MIKLACTVLSAFAIYINCYGAEIVDDFAKGGWKQFVSTPGKFSCTPEKMYLRDAEGDPNWITASKTVTVDIDKTPFFIVKVVSLSDSGTVKLIQKKPFDKKIAVQIDQPGLYALDMSEKFGWKGKRDIEVCLYASGDESEIVFSYIKFVGILSDEVKAQIKKRESIGNLKLQKKPFSLLPLFNSCGIYFKSVKRKTLLLLFRKQNGEWRKAFPLVYIKEDGMYRGSIVNLEEDTQYEIKLIDSSGKILKESSFQTWGKKLRIAETIVLNDKKFKKSLKITASGSPEGWIKYTSEKGFILKNNREKVLIDLYKAKYIILEGLTLRGGDKNAISVRRCENIRIVNCDIAGWGRDGTQRFDLDGKYYTKQGKAINWDAGILISKSLGTVVERCYIHDPVSRANSWIYSHPAGPQAVGIDKPVSTVLRYNDFIGSDEHRWNDGIEGVGNFHYDGGFNRDADIYGNMICFANDDCIEIDGGQTNVRVFLNKFEGALCGVSIQGCMSSPSYVFKNLLVNMGDEFGFAGQTLKTSSHKNGKSAVSFIFNNTCFGRSNDLNIPHNLRIVAKNNIFSGTRAVTGRKRSPQSECDYNLLSSGNPGDEKHGILGKPQFLNAKSALFASVKTSPAAGNGTAIDNFSPALDGKVDIGAIPVNSKLVLPYRPIPLTLDKYQLNFSPEMSKKGISQTITATVSDRNFSEKYRIRKNSVFDWFEVSPEEGVLESGKNITFKVKMLPGKMLKRALYKGLFLVRLESGYSRPVTVYAQTGISPEIKPTDKGVVTEFFEAEKTSGGKTYKLVPDLLASGGQCIVLSGEKAKNPAEYTFNIPKKGEYFILFRVKSDEPVGSHNSLYFSIDDKPLEASHLMSSVKWRWALAAHNKSSWSNTLQLFEMTPGKHTLKIAPREKISLDLIVITDDPSLFN